MAGVADPGRLHRLLGRERCRDRGGGPVVYHANLHFEFAAPLNSSADVTGTCRSVVGEPELVAEVVPSVDGLVSVDLHSFATGRGARWSGPNLAWAHLTNDGVAGNDFQPPNIPERPALYADRMTPSGMSITFMRAYDYQVTIVAESGFSGVAELAGTRFKYYGDQGVNAVLANDPWPETYELSVSWACEAAKP